MLDLSQTGNGDRGQIVSVEVTPNDSTLNGTLVSASATVADSAPPATVRLNTSNPKTNDTLTATATKADADGDAVTLTYVWMVNGSVVKTTTGSSSLTDTLDLSQPGNGDKGQTVTVVVTPSDGTLSGTPVSASASVINSAPTATVTLNTASPKTNDILTAAATKADADGDAVTLTYVWKVNGAVVKTTANSTSLTDTLDLGQPGNGDKGQVVSVEVTPNDGTVNGTLVSASATVAESAPVAGNDSYNVLRNNTLTVAAPGVLANDRDADHDPLTIQQVSSPINGNVTLNPDGSFTYVPNSGFVGNDAFTYKLNDGQDDSNVATVLISVSDATVGAVTHFSVTPSSNSVIAGAGFGLTVTALDANNLTVTNFSGTITFASNDGQSLVPATALTTFNNGVGFVVATLKTSTSTGWTITATDSAVPTAHIGGTGPITVSAAAASHLSVSALNSAVVGVPTSVTVTALDPFNNVATSYLGTVHFTSTDSALTPISNATFVSGNAGVQSFNATFNTPALVQTITAADTGNATINGTSNAIKVQGLAVSNFTPTDTGFVATFDKGFNATALHLYAQTTAALTNPSVTVVLGASTKIAGTLLVNTAANTITFVKTNTTTTTPSALAAGIYTVTFLSSTTNGFVDNSGDLLAGDTNGVVPGTNYTTTFTVTAATAAEPTVFVADFARGPDSSSTIKVPNNTGTGIPLTLTNATAVTSVTFTMSYDPTLLNITGVSGANLTLVSNTGGLATFSYTNATPQNGTVILGQILADVPNSAANNYKAKELLHIGSPVINGTNTTVRSGDGIHINAYLGDVSGNGIVNGADVNSISFIPGGGFTGFSAFPLADPVILGDVNADGLVNSTDLGQYNRFVANLTAPTIPVPPTGLTFTATGPDPTLSIPAKLPALAGGTVTVPVDLDDPHPVGSTGMTEATLALVFNPQVLSVSAADIHLGSIPLSGTGWKLVSVVDAATGQIGIDLYSTTPIADATAGNLVTITFHVNNGTAPGATAVELVASNSANPDGQGILRTEVDDKQGAFVLTPARSTARAA